MEEWKTYKLKDITSVLGDGIHGTPKYDPNGEIYFINGNNLKDGHIDFDNNTKRVSLKESRLHQRPLNDRTILFSIINGTIGNVAKYKGEPCILGKSACFFNVKEEFDVNFIYYLVANQNFKNSITQLATGTTIKNVSLETMRNYEFSIPLKGSQEKISKILQSLDDKIELNRRINDNLEQQAQALFNQFFIDDPTSLGNYTLGNLTDLADYINGLAMQNFRPQVGEQGIPVLKIKELGQESIDTSSDLCSDSINNTYKVHDGDVIFSWSGTLMVKIWCGGLCGLNQHLFKVTSTKYPKWLYYFWTKHHLDKFIRIAQDKAVTMGHIKRGELSKSEVIIPDGPMLAKIDALITPMLNKIIVTKQESRKLSQFRDTLLPKLMSGEININA